MRFGWTRLLMRQKSSQRNSIVQSSAASVAGGDMTYKGVFWYGLILMLLSFIAGVVGTGSVLDGLFAMAVNWVFLVLPVLLIRNARERRRSRRATV